MTRCLLLLLSLAFCGLAGCGVDDRKLAPGPPFMPIGGAAGAADGPGTDSWQGCDASGDGGAASASDMVHCWSFDHDTEGWTAEAGIARAFSQDDASMDAASGSLSVVSQDFGSDDQLLAAGVYQCLPIPYADRYALELKALVPPQPVAGGVSIELQFINVVGCQGIILSHPQFAGQKSLVWEAFNKGGEVPRGARSLLFRLLVDKFHNDPRAEARFDHVRLTFE
jgi:hypothetical protein